MQALKPYARMSNMTPAEQSANSLTPTAGSLSDQEIIQFLTEDPEFFQRNPGVLEALSIPHEKGTAISLIERQVDLLREKNRVLEEQLNSLVSIAKENNEKQQQIHRMLIDLLASNNAVDTLEKLSSKLATNFDVEQVVIRLFADNNHPLTGIDEAWVLTSHSARETLDDFTPSNEPLCGRLKTTQLKRLFGDNADTIASSVLIPLRKDILHGVIALGSSDEHRFNPGMDTLYLQRMGELIAAALLRFID